MIYAVIFYPLSRFIRSNISSMSSLKHVIKLSPYIFPWFWRRTHPRLNECEIEKYVASREDTPFRTLTSDMLTIIMVPNFINSTETGGIMHQNSDLKMWSICIHRHIWILENWMGIYNPGIQARHSFTW